MLNSMANNTHQTSDINIAGMAPLMTPAELKEEFKASDAHNDFIYASRKVVQDSLTHKDDRIIFIVGPCSIHDLDAAIDYAEKLKVLADKFADKMFIVMRTYFEKPRTRTGWKGLINDPNLDGSTDILKGIRQARKLLVQLQNSAYQLQPKC